MSKGDAEERSFPGILYAEPAALGIIANVMSAMIVAILNMTIDEATHTSLLTAGIHLIVIGGLFQLFSGLMSFRRNDHFTSTAFVFLSSLWCMYGINMILSTRVDSQLLQHSTFAVLIGYCLGLSILNICSLTVSYIMPPLLLFTLFTLIFEAIGLFHIWSRYVAACFELLVVLTGSYSVLVIVLKGVSQRYVLPGFGNAPYNVLLLKSKSKPGQQKEDKRTTKYAEPYALTYLGNLVPSIIFAFHHFGYFGDFTLALPCLLSAMFCQLFSCYYSYLRHDTFHACQSFIYLTFWLSRSLAESSLFWHLDVPSSSPSNQFALIGISIVSLILVVASLTQSKMVFVNNIVFSLLTVLSLNGIPSPVLQYTFAITSGLFALVSIYTCGASMLNTIAEKTIVYVGSELTTRDNLKLFFIKLKFWERHTVEGEKKFDNTDLDHNIADVLSLIGTAIAAFTLCGTFATSTLSSHPISAAALLVPGVGAHLLAVRLSFVTRTLSKCYSHVISAAIWMTWAAVLYRESLGYSMKSSAIGLTCMHVTVLCLSLAFKRLWLPVAMLMQANVICLLLHCYDIIPYHAVSAILGILGVLCVYGSFATFINGIVRCNVIPVGRPILKMRTAEVEETEPPCPTFSSKLTSGVSQVAKIMNDGGVCGIPTDTVYALSASCKYPESIVRIFEIKGRSKEKPMCLCLAYLDQLKDVNPDFSPLLWAFMRRCYPGGISCVVPKGPWLERLGIAHASEHIGTAGSVCIRVPDCTPLAHLIAKTGPVVLTSANPSGAIDSTHHDMVIDRLGYKLDAVLCDGYSRELVASTVVNCLNIDEGKITYFRVGCYPTDKIDAIFQEVMNSNQA